MKFILVCFYTIFEEPIKKVFGLPLKLGRPKFAVNNSEFDGKKLLLIKT